MAHRVGRYVVDKVSIVFWRVWSGGNLVCMCLVRKLLTFLPIFANFFTAQKKKKKSKNYPPPKKVRFEAKKKMGTLSRSHTVHGVVSAFAIG